MTAAVVALGGVALRLCINVPADAHGYGLLGEALHTLALFTITSNVVVGVVAVLRVRDPLRCGPWFDAVWLASLVMISVTGIIYWLLPAGDPLAGLDRWANLLTHTLTPAAAVLSWLLAGPHGQLRFGPVPRMLVTPVAWLDGRPGLRHDRGMRLRFVTCDVFTDTRFGGNPLAVLPDARGLTGAQMQQVAREFNYSESTFVLPPDRGRDRRVRIFTPTREVPFAGHPNVGTAFALARLGELGPIDGTRTVVFEELAGDVPVEVVDLGQGRYRCELRAPEPLSLGAALPVDAVAAAVGLESSEVISDRHPPQVASVGLAFVVAELRDRAALARARPDSAALERLVAAGAATPDVHLYVRTGGDDEGLDLRTRMFAPFDGVPEDPATGSANAALAGLLAQLEPAADGTLAWRIAQGVEMGRPSALVARAEKRAGAVTGVWIAGESVLVSEGWIEV